jgi:hypothetical protein
MKFLISVIRVYIQNHNTILLQFTTLSKQRYSSINFLVNERNCSAHMKPFCLKEKQPLKSSTVMYQDSLSPNLYYQDAFAVFLNAHHLKCQNVQQRHLPI